jgi:cytochrome P450
MILGIQPDGSSADALRQAYHQLGGNGLVWTPGLRQEQAVRSIADILHTAAAEVDRNSILGQLNAQGCVDKIMMGNLIYMVEMGRYDTTAFLRWLMWFAAKFPDQGDRIAREPSSSSFANAFVMEVLRLEQAERLVRRVTRDFVADGFLFPKGAMVRFCIWESHKLTDAYDRPFEFDPSRFLESKPGPDRYSPFGADRHQCPFGTFSVRFGATFLQALSRKYRLNADGPNRSVRGLYHWEPENTFCPALTPRNTAVPN